MSTTRDMTIRLPAETADFINAKVSSGEYEDPSEVIRDSIVRMQIVDFDTDVWVRAEVLPALDELDAHPESGLSLQQVQDHFVAKRTA